MKLKHTFSSKEKLTNLGCMKVTQLCLTLCNTVDCSLPGFSVYGILQAKILDWVAFFFSKRSSGCKEMNLGKFWEMVRAGRPSMLQSLGSQRVAHD